MGLISISIKMKRLGFFVSSLENMKEKDKNDFLSFNSSELNHR